MILKIAKAFPKNNWKFVPDVEEFDYEWISKTEKQNIISEPNLYIQATNELGKMDENNQRYVYGIATLRGRYFSVISNLTVYLLNDEGKTIERIN